MKRSDEADLARTLKPRKKPYKPRHVDPPRTRRLGMDTICDPPGAGACNTLYAKRGPYKPRHYVSQWDRSPYMHDYPDHAIRRRLVAAAMDQSYRLASQLRRHLAPAPHRVWRVARRAEDK